MALALPWVGLSWLGAVLGGLTWLWLAFDSPEASPEASATLPKALPTRPWRSSKAALLNVFGHSKRFCNFIKIVLPSKRNAIFLGLDTSMLVPTWHQVDPC